VPAAVGPFYGLPPAAGAAFVLQQPARAQPAGCGPGEFSRGCASAGRGMRVPAGMLGLTSPVEPAR